MGYSFDVAKTILSKTASLEFIGLNWFLVVFVKHEQAYDYIL